MEKKKDAVKVVVFDLNGTFYNKSSKDEFFRFICSKKPGRLRYVITIGYYYLRKKLNTIRRTEFKENFFNYLDGFPPSQVEKYAKEFWAREFPDNFHKTLFQRFKELRKDNVLVVCATGGIELYVKPLFDLYEIDGLVGTQAHYDGHTYKVEGKACKGEEKLVRLGKLLKNQPYRIIEAYSDSKEEILEKAEKAYLLDNGEIRPFKKEEN